MPNHLPPAVLLFLTAALGAPRAAAAQSQLVSRAGTARGATKCLVIQNASRAQGSPAVLWDCNGGDNEKITFANNSVSVYGGSMCLDTYPGAGNDGDAAKIYPCHGGGATDSQRWVYTAAGEIKNVRSGRCLDIQGGVASSTTNGKAILLWDCSGNQSQSWATRGAQVAAAPAPAPAPAAPALVSVPVSQGMALMTDDGRCVYGGAGGMGVASAGACNMGYGIFKPVYHAQNYYTINTNNGQCVTNPAAKGGAVTTQPCTQAPAQRYYMNSSGQLQQVGTNLCIDVSGGQRLTSYRLVAWDCDLNGNVGARAWNQRFTFSFLAVVPPGLSLNSTFALGARSYAQGASGKSAVAAPNESAMPSLISQDGGGLVASGGGNIVASGGGNVIAIGASNIVASGGGNIVASGGGNILLPASGIVASGGGNVIFAGKQ